MQIRDAAERWAETWASAWPRKDVDAIAELQASDGDHWASMFRPFRGRDGLRDYLEECFAEETRPAETWFARPIVDGDAATVEYWVVITVEAGPVTISGCTVLQFDESGLVSLARDYSHIKEGRHPRPIGALSH